MKKEINFIELEKTTMINLNEQQKEVILHEIKNLINQSSIFDKLDLNNVEPLENIANASFNFLREDVVINQETNPKEVLKLHNKVIEDFGVLKNEK